MALGVLAELDDMGVFGVWAISLVGSVIAIVAVVLLAFGITRTVLIIDERLDHLIGVGQQIQDNTNPLFDLEKTMRFCEQLRSTVAAIEDDAKAVLGRAGTSQPGSRVGR